MDDVNGDCHTHTHVVRIQYGIVRDTTIANNKGTIACLTTTTTTTATTRGRRECVGENFNFAMNHSNLDKFVPDCLGNVLSAFVGTHRHTHCTARRRRQRWRARGCFNKLTSRVPIHFYSFCSLYFIPSVLLGRLFIRLTNRVKKQEKQKWSKLSKQKANRKICKRNCTRKKDIPAQRIQVPSKLSFSPFTHCPPPD